MLYLNSLVHAVFSCTCYVLILWRQISLKKVLLAQLLCFTVVLLTVFCTSHTTDCVLHFPHYWLCFALPTLLTVFCTSHTTDCVLHFPHYWLCFALPTLLTVFCTSHTTDCVLHFPHYWQWRTFTQAVATSSPPLSGSRSPGRTAVCRAWLLTWCFLRPRCPPCWLVTHPGPAEPARQGQQKGHNTNAARPAKSCCCSQYLLGCTRKNQILSFHQNLTGN